MAPEKKSATILWFNEITLRDVSLVGGKNASLGEMYQNLTPLGVRVPNGFALTSNVYWQFLKENKLQRLIAESLNNLDTENSIDLSNKGALIRHALSSGKFSSETEDLILSAYHRLPRLDVAVRSSATAEDLPEASFAGQQETYLNVQGDAQLLESCRRCIASLFTDRAICYRVNNHFDHLSVALSVAVQEMVRSDLGAAGVMFSLDTESGFRNAILINGSYGLGENVVQGSVNPDEFLVFKPTLSKNFRPILKKQLGSKEVKLIYDSGGSKMVKNIPVSQGDRDRFCLTDDEILQLSRWGIQIEDYFSKLKGQLTPMDMEWGRDGRSGDLYILQARPETVHSQKSLQNIETYHLDEKSKILVSGRSVGEKISSGPARIVKNVEDLGQVKLGDVLVTDKTDPDWVPTMKKAVGIVTNRGGRTCHAAIVSRELGLPAIVGTINGTEAIQNGQVVTISCSEGEAGNVYDGQLKYHVEKADLRSLENPKTKVMLILADPDEAFRLSFLPNDGVGLVRMEFIVNNSIKIHPRALIDFEKLEESESKEKIRQLTSGYSDKGQFFVDRLAQGVGMIAAAFYPKPVIVRMSDFKSNEYANLIGGKKYEPVEENPMIGFRGASRYYHPLYKDAFVLECKAMKKVIDEMGLENRKLMIPFCRTVEEGRKVLAVMESCGLKRGEKGLEVYVMCEIPSNVILAEEFAEIFDGFSIGSNDLTQLTLGVDRDSELVASLFDERNSAVKSMISQAIQKVHKAGRKIGLCGQAPSDYPEFADFLVAQGIDSISLNADVLLKTRVLIAEGERRL